jgi:hypothetical protein
LQEAARARVLQKLDRARPLRRARGALCRRFRGGLGASERRRRLPLARAPHKALVRARFVAFADTLTSGLARGLLERLRHVAAEGFELLRGHVRPRAVNYPGAEPRAVAEDKVVRELVKKEDVATHVRLFANGLGALRQQALQLARTLGPRGRLLEKVEPRGANQRDEPAPL